MGDTLRRTREAQGLSISEVANALKLNARQIEALESGRFAQLPGLAFTRGFLRNYARLLKIDAAPLLAGLQAPDAGEPMELAPASNAHGDMPQVGRGPCSALPSSTCSACGGCTWRRPPPLPHPSRRRQWRRPPQA